LIKVIGLSSKVTLDQGVIDFGDDEETAQGENYCGVPEGEEETLRETHVLTGLQGSDREQERDGFQRQQSLVLVVLGDEVELRRGDVSGERSVEISQRMAEAIVKFLASALDLNRVRLTSFISSDSHQLQELLFQSFQVEQTELRHSVRVLVREDSTGAGVGRVSAGLRGAGGTWAG
jgi:hypothetical protein